MRIAIEKCRDRVSGKKYYRADFVELSGSPYVGIAGTKAMAVARLFATHLSSGKLKFLDMSAVEIVKGKR